MRTLAFALALGPAACGGGAQQAPAPAPAPRTAVAEPVAPPEAAAPAPSAAKAEDGKQHRTSAEAIALLPIEPGALAGSPAITIASTPSTLHCGGTAVSATIRKRKPAPEPELAAVFALPQPTGLTFDDADPAGSDVDYQAFATWHKTLQDRLGAAYRRYGAIAADKKRPVAERVVVSARWVQLLRWSAQVTLRMEIPVAARKDAATRTWWCDTVAQKLDFTLDAIELATKTCRVLAAEAGPGWWDQACSR